MAAIDPKEINREHPEQNKKVMDKLSSTDSNKAEYRST